MSRRDWLWLVCLLFGSGGSAYLLVADGAHDEAGTLRKEHPSRLLSVPLRDVSAIKFQFAAELVEIRRTEQGWLTLQDGQPVTRKIVLDGPLAKFAATRIERRFKSQADNLEDYGLLKPFFKVTILAGDRAATAQSFDVGAVSPDGFGQFILLHDSGEVALIPAFQINNLLHIARR